MAVDDRNNYYDYSINVSLRADAAGATFTNLLSIFLFE